MRKISGFLKGLLNGIGDEFPELSAGLGKTVLATFDIIPGGLFLTWVVNVLAPEEFKILGTVFSWMLPTALYFVVYQLFKEDRKGQVEVKHVLAWGLNLADALFIDGAGVFILFGATDILASGMAGLNTAVAKMPIFGWFIYLVTVILSASAEWYRRKMKESVPVQQPDYRELREVARERERQNRMMGKSFLS